MTKTTNPAPSLVYKAGLWLFFAALSLFAHINPLPEAHAAGASLYIAPASGSYSVGSQFTVSIKVNTGGQAVNAAQGSLSFDNSVLEAVSAGRGGSVFNLWTTEPSISGSSINFGGGIPHPGYNGGAGHVFSVTFKAKKPGTGFLKFTSGSILANDGKGTDIASGLGSASWTITSAGKPPAPATGEPSPEPPAPRPSARLVPVIESSTHPDQNKWYSANKAVFSWDLPGGATGVSISLNKEAADDPGPVSDGLFEERTYENLEDGIWYLHLKFKDSQGWGSIENYRLMIDTKPPQPVKTEYLKGGENEWPLILFEFEDNESGLLKYEIFIGSLEQQAHEVEPDKKELMVEGLSAGKHTALIKAIDKAGNESVEMIEFYIDPIPTPSIDDYSREIRPGDKFYMSGQAFPNSRLDVYIEKDGRIAATSSTAVDSNGHWLFLAGNTLPKGRYTAWVDAVSDKGIRSEASSRVSFMVTPPVFTTVGRFVLDYFTVLVSLIFLSVLIVFLIVLIYLALKKKVRKEAFEAEDIVKHRLDVYKKGIDVEFDKLKELESKPALHKKEKEEVRNRLKEKIESIKNDSLKEISDVEKLVK